MKIQINTNELDPATTRAVEMVVRHKELIADMRGFLGYQHADTDDRYLIDAIREKASGGIIQEAAKAIRRERADKKLK